MSKFSRRSVPRSVGGLQVHDSGPMDPRPLHPVLWIKPTSNGRLWRLVEQLPWISDVAGPLGTPGDTHVGLASVASGPLAPCRVHLLPMSIFVTNLHKFCYNYCIQIILQAQMELGEL
jgi:hypothetical protein